MKTEQSIAEVLSSLLNDCKLHNADRKKLGKIFQGYVTQHWPAAGLPFSVRSEDSAREPRINPTGQALWRLRRTGEAFLAPGSSRIDFVVRNVHGTVVALIEVESDIDDIKNPTRAGDANYFVHSISKNSAGFPFASYHSLERMAIASLRLAGKDTSVSALELIHSDGVEAHNPLRIPLFLVNTPGPQYALMAALEPRMRSLGVTPIF